MEVLQKQLANSNTRFNRLKQKFLHLKRKMQSMDDLIATLKSENLISNSGELLLQVFFLFLISVLRSICKIVLLSFSFTEIL